MGIFDRFFSKEKPETRKLTIEQAIQELRKDIKVDEFGPTFVRLRKVKNDVMVSLQELYTKDFSGDVEPRLKNVVVGAKEAFYNKVYPFVDRIGEGADDLEKVNETYSTILTATEEVNKAMRKYAERISFGFDKELGNFSSRMSEFNKIIDAMKKRLEDKNKASTRRMRNLELLEDYIRSKKRLEEMKSDIVSMEKRITVAEKKLTQAERSIEMFDIDDRAKEGMALKKEIKGIDEEINKLRKQIHGLYLDIEKPLKSYKARVSKTDFSKVIDLFSDEPLELLSRQKERETMVDILKDLEKQIKDGDIMLNPKRKSKAISALGKTKLNVLSYRYMALLKSKKQKENQIESVGYERQKVVLTTKKSDLERHVNSLKTQLENMRRATKEKEDLVKKLKIQTTTVLGEMQ